MHGFAGVIGGMYKKAPHGEVCASLLAACIEKTVQVLEAKDPNSEYLAKFQEVAKIITKNNEAKGEDGVAWIRKLCLEMKVSRLADFGISKDDFKVIAEKSSTSSSMQGNPIKLSMDDLFWILETCY